MEEMLLIGMVHPSFVSREERKKAEEKRKKIELQFRKQQYNKQTYLLTGGSKQFGWNTLAHVSQLSSLPFLPQTMQTLSIVF